MNGPLSHLRVVDCTDLRGALAGRLLADLGADVVKVDSPEGEPDRAAQPLAWLYRNANKRGTRTRAGDARFEALLGEADVLLENVGPQGHRRHEALRPASVRRRHPRLVHVALSDFGLSGPRAAWRLEPLPAFAASGGLHASGFPDHPPCWLPGFLAHDCASVFGVAGAIAAVLDRARHGDGQTIEIATQEAALNALNPWSIPLEAYNRIYPMIPTAPPRNADGNYYVLPVSDGFVRILPATSSQWAAFLDLLRHPEALEGPEWNQFVWRLLNVDLIRAVAGEALQDRPRAAVVDEGHRLGVPIGPVNTPEEFIEEAQTKVRGFFRATGFQGVGNAPFAAAPFVFSRTPVTLRRRAPVAEDDDQSGFGPSSQELQASDATQPLLAGMRVLSLGVVAVLPETTWLLAELGAEVVKIESRTKLDPLRAVTIDPSEPNKSFTFNAGHRGQKSVLVNLTTAAGRALVLRLAAQADIVVENNRGGVVRAWGLDYDDIRKVRPDVIYLASQGYGRGGPLGETQAFGPMNSSFAGTQWMWNFPGVPYPGGTSLNHPDHIASKLGACAILAALEHRRRTGEGQFIDMAQTEAAAFLVGEVYLQKAVTGIPTAPRGNAVDHACPHGVYPADGDDRWIAIAITADAQWDAFVRATGVPATGSMATLAGRMAARDEVDALVAGWTKGLDGEAAATILQNAGISAMPVQNGDDHRRDAHLLARGALPEVTHAEVGPERHAGNPIRPSRMPMVVAAAAPCLGAHTSEVLGGWLGLSEAELRQLEDDGICK